MGGQETGGEGKKGRDSGLEDIGGRKRRKERQVTGARRQKGKVKKTVSRRKERSGIMEREKNKGDRRGRKRKK
jgi:hypothetical protein